MMKGNMRRGKRGGVDGVAGPSRRLLITVMCAGEEFGIQYVYIDFSGAVSLTWILLY